MGAWSVPAFGALTFGPHEPGPPGPGQLRVATRAFSLNYRDALMRAGRYDPRVPLPYVPLSDMVGTVEAVGPGVDRFRVGDRVCGTFSPTWIDGVPDADALRKTRGGPLPGFAAEAVLLEASAAVAPPRAWTDVEAATLPCAGVTAWSAVVVHGAVKPGDVVLVLGTGGVSAFACAIARAAGARVVAVTTRRERMDTLRAWGAEHVCCSADEPRWGRAIRKVVGAGVDLVVEVGGSGTLQESIEAARIGGTVALVGNLAVPQPVDHVAVLMKQLRVQGVFVGPRRAFEDLVRAAESGGWRPIVDRVFPFQALPEAFAHFSAQAHVGKVVVGG